MVMKLTLLSIVLATCLAVAAPVSYKDAVGASSAAPIIDKNWAKREGLADAAHGVTAAIGNSATDVAGAGSVIVGERNGLVGNRKRESGALAGNIQAIVDKTLVIDVAKRGGD